MDTTEETTGWYAVKQTWTDRDRWAAVLLGAAPSLVFVLVDAVTSLYPALFAAALAAVGALAYRLIRRQSPRGALIGILIVAICAVAAAVTGEARGFFLVPMLIPFAVIVLCLATIVAGRPLTGLLLNRIAGGPKDWPRDRGLRRVHLLATAAAIAINAVNATVQVIFYGRGDTIVLAVAHAATGPAFAALVAATIVAARRRLPSRPAPGLIEQ
jgi:hypothetical protein